LYIKSCFLTVKIVVDFVLSNQNIYIKFLIEPVSSSGIIKDNILNNGLLLFSFNCCF